jgi:hypothetical protein
LVQELMPTFMPVQIVVDMPSLGRLPIALHRPLRAIQRNCPMLGVGMSWIQDRPGPDRGADAGATR